MCRWMRRGVHSLNHDVVVATLMSRDIGDIFLKSYIYYTPINNKFSPIVSRVITEKLKFVNIANHKIKKTFLF